MKRITSGFREKVTNQNLILFYLSYCLVFFLFAGFAFCLFLITKRSFIWFKDGWNQHFRALLYYSKWLKDVARNILVFHQFSLPTFSAHIGLGSDVIQTLHYYVIGDPLALFSVFVSQNHMARFYSLLIYVRIFLAGLAFSIYAIYMACKINEKGKETISLFAILMATMVYTFNGFTLYAGTRHPYFLNPMILMPLVFLGVEKIFDSKRPYVLIIFVALSCISNFYFFYMIVVLTVMYVITRFLMLYKLNALAGWKKILRILIHSIQGTLIGMFMLMPQLIAFTNSNRSSNHILSAWIPNLEVLSTKMEALLAAVNTGENWTVVGISFIALVAVFVFFVQKGYKALKVLFILLTLMLLSPKGGSFMNGFSYPANRWSFGYIFFICMLFMMMWSHLLKPDSKEKKAILVGILMAVIIICFNIFRIVPTSIHAIKAIMGTIFCILIGVITIVFLFSDFKHTMISMLCLLLAASTANAYFLYAKKGVNYINQMYTYKQVRFNLKHDELEALDSLLGKNKNVNGRIEGTNYYLPVQGNHLISSDRYSVQYFWSLENGLVPKMRSENGLTDNYFSYLYGSFQNRTILSTLANVKYYMGDRAPDHYEKVGDYKSVNGKTYHLYQNDLALPFGYTYDHTIDEKTYAKLDQVKKQEALLQGIVLDQKDEHLTSIQPQTTSQEVPYKITKFDGVKKNGNTYVALKNNAAITLTIDTPKKKAETYVKLGGLSFTCPRERSNYTNRQWQSLSIDQKLYALYLNDNLTYNQQRANIWAQYSKDGQAGNFTWTPIFMPYNDQYRKIGDRVLSLGTTSGGKESIRLTLAKKGTYHIGKMETYKQPLDLYEKQVPKLSQDYLTNVKTYETRDSHATNKLTANITVRKNKYLLLTIPYMEGWEAKVDGKKVKIIKANTMWQALYLKKGAHSIELTYHTPSLFTGTMTSLLGLISVIVYIIYDQKKKNSEKSLESNE